MADIAAHPEWVKPSGGYVMTGEDAARIKKAFDNANAHLTPGVALDGNTEQGCGPRTYTYREVEEMIDFARVSDFQMFVDAAPSNGAFITVTLQTARAVAGALRHEGR